MTTQKTLKRRVRARAAKTGEAYTAARSQLLRRAASSTQPTPTIDAMALTGMTDDAMRRGSGRTIAEWIEILDEWGAADRRHPEIARWLVQEHGIGGWWSQSVTVAYERARGMRAMHEQPDGFAVSATKTVNVPADRASLAFTDEARRAEWLPAAPMRERTSRSGRSARFDWADPPSRLVVGFVAKGDAKSVVSLQHEKLPDAAAAERMKAMWRERLVALKRFVEAE